MIFIKDEMDVIISINKTTIMKSIIIGPIIDRKASDNGNYTY